MRNFNWIKLIFLFTFILSFFVNLVIPVGNIPIPIVVIFMTLSYIGIFLYYKKEFINFLLLLKKKNNLAFPLLIFIPLILIEIPFYILAGHFSLLKFIMQFLGIFVFQVLFIFLLFGFITYKIFSEKNIYKLIILSIFLILLLGIFDFITAYLHLEPAMNFINLMSNQRFLALAEYGDRVYIGNIPRLQSIFMEPAVFAIFLVSFLPFSYALFNSKYKVVKNKYINILIKKSLLPCLWFNLIFTQSPIFLIFGLIITIFYFKDNLFSILKKQLYLTVSILTFVVCFACIIVNKFDLSETFLNRIFLVLEVLKDFNKFIIVEPSLATRVVNYVNSLCVWLKHPIFGVGIGNLSIYQAAQMQHSPVPLTQEIINHLYLKTFVFNTGVFYKLMAETGIVGTFTYFYFWAKLYNFSKKLFIKAKFNNLFVLYKGLWGIVWVYIILCFYNMYLYYAYYYVFAGIIVGLQIKNYMIKRRYFCVK